jgi:hypothetical protein
MEYFEVSVENIKIMEALQSKDNLDERFPDELLFEILFDFLLCEYFLVEISIIRELHHYAL